MKNFTTEIYNEKAKSGARYYIRATIDGVPIQDELQNFDYNANCNPDRVFSIGNVGSAMVEFEIYQPSQNLTNKEILIEQGIKLNGVIEYVKLGYFNVLKPTNNRGIYKYQCVDRMISKMEMPYFSELTFPTTDIAMLKEICTQVGISLDNENSLISHTITNNLQGYTKREIIAYLSQLQGKNAIINSEGNLELIWYTPTNYVVDDDKIYMDRADEINSETDYVIEYIKCNATTSEGIIEIQSGDGLNGITISNPFMTQAILDEVFASIGGFSFRPVEFDFYGDFRLEVGDVITLSTYGQTYSVPIMQITQKSDGGVITSITSIAETETENNINIKSPNTKEMDRYYAELVMLNKAMISKLDVTELRAVKAEIQKAVIEEAEMNFATIKQLEVTTAKVQDLTTKALTADSAIIKELTAKTTKTDTLIFGSAGGNVIQTSFSNSVIAQLGDAQIKSAMIQDISASKIVAGTIYTDDVTVQSRNGQMMLKDNTIQISDGTRARVQIGKDASNDYSINIWDKSGNLMFSQGGITDKAIKQAIIRNDMVSENANIHAGKLDINSLFTEINGSSNTIKATKIYLDEQKQTLEASFRTMTTTVDGLKQTQSSQGTQLEVLNGKIASKVWQQDITTAIDDINIGGRNLLLNSSEKRNTTINNAGTQQATVIYMYSEYGKKILHDGSVAQITVSLDYSTELTQGTLAVQSGYDKWNSFGHVSLADSQSGHLECTFDIPAEWLGSTNIGLRVIVDGFGEQTETVVVSNFKCEIGNKATSYTVAPEDTDSEIVTLTTKYSSLEQNMEGFKTTVSETYTTLDAFNNLSVGGRNLLLNSKTFSKATTQNQTNQALNIGIFSDYFMSERAVGKQITVSFDWTTTATSGKFQILFNNTPWSTIFPNSTITISSSNKSGRVEYTATLTDAAVNSSATYTGLRIRIDNIEGTTTVSNVKCEFGNKATDWTPAPEDVESEITTVQTIAQQTADKFNWLVKSGTSSSNFTLTDRMAELTASIISLNGNVKVNGEMIVDGAITAGKIAANAITADKVNITNLFSEEIQVNGKFKAIGSAWVPPTKEDLDLLRKSINGEITLTAAQKTAFDFDVNGKVDLFDFAICKSSILHDLDILSKYPLYNPVNSNVNVTINPKNPKKIIDITATNSFGRNIDIFFGMDGINVPSVDTGLINCYSVNSQDDVIANYGADNQTSLSDLHNINNMIKVLYNGTVSANSEGVMTIVFDNTYAKKLSRMGVMFIQINDSTGTHYGYTAIPYLNNASSWGTYGDKIFNIYANNGGIDTVKLTRSSDASAHTTVTIKPNVSNTYAEKTANVRIFSLSLGVI